MIYGLSEKDIDSSAKRRCKMIWDVLAAEYYSEAHRTSRNFDRIIRHNVPRIIKKLCPDGLYLDLGGGRGLLEELFSQKSATTVVGDFSIPMMRTGSGSLSSTCYVQMDAFGIPFRANSFDGVFSLLGDPYALYEVFEEVLRVLKLGGFFFITLPTKLWAENLRPFLGVKTNETRFLTQDGKTIKIPSFTYDSKDLRENLLVAGFKKVKTGEWGSLDLVSKEDFSEDVLIVARNLGISPEDLPLITYALAYKSEVI